MRTLKYKTGRTYDFEQVLEIIVTGEKVDEDNFVDYEIVFRDKSRHIIGRTTVFMGASYEDFSDNKIGKNLLSSYDTCHYESISNDDFLDALDTHMCNDYVARLGIASARYL